MSTRVVFFFFFFFFFLVSYCCIYRRACSQVTILSELENDVYIFHLVRV